MTPTKATRLRLFYVQHKVTEELQFLQRHLNKSRLCFILERGRLGVSVEAAQVEYNELQDLIRARIQTIEARLARVNAMSTEVAA